MIIYFEWAMSETKERKQEKSMLFYQLKLESCYLQSASIKENEKDVKAAAERIIELVKRFEDV